MGVKLGTNGFTVTSSRIGFQRMGRKVSDKHIIVKHGYAVYIVVVAYRGVKWRMVQSKKKLR